MMLETSIVVVIITAFYLISEGLLAHCSTMVLENVTKLALQFNFIVLIFQMWLNALNYLLSNKYFIIFNI